MSAVNAMCEGALIYLEHKKTSQKNKTDCKNDNCKESAVNKIISGINNKK